MKKAELLDAIPTKRHRQAPRKGNALAIHAIKDVNLHLLALFALKLAVSLVENKDVSPSCMYLYQAASHALINSVMNCAIRYQSWYFTSRVVVNNLSVWFVNNRYLLRFS